MIAICPNPFRDTGLQLTLKIRGVLRAAGYDTVVCPVFADDEPDIIPKEIPTVRLEAAAGECSLIVVVGGDGTLLSVVRTLHDCAVPILGVNLGTKGFMTTLEPEDIDLIPEAAEGGMTVSRRMKLDIELSRGGETVYTDCALNDAVVHGYGDCIRLTAMCDGDTITAFSGDGIVLATPTGSTGYSMSAGGPIVEPDAENILVTPICAHVMGARSFVLDPVRTVTVKTEKLHGRRAYLSVDGNPVYDLANDDVVTVRRSARYTEMVNMGHKSFYDIAYEKLT